MSVRGEAHLDFSSISLGANVADRSFNDVALIDETVSFNIDMNALLSKVNLKKTTTIDRSAPKLKGTDMRISMVNYSGRGGIVRKS